MKPTVLLTRGDVEILRRKKPGTNGKTVSVTEKEVEEMKMHLGTLYTSKIYMSFAEKICFRNKAY